MLLVLGGMTGLTGVTGLASLKVIGGVASLTGVTGLASVREGESVEGEGKYTMKNQVNPDEIGVPLQYMHVPWEKKIHPLIVIITL